MIIPDHDLPLTPHWLEGGRETVSVLCPQLACLFKPVTYLGSSGGQDKLSLLAVEMIHKADSVSLLVNIDLALPCAVWRRGLSCKLQGMCLIRGL